MRKIITITRQYGSGGRLIAQEVAKNLQIAYYDNEIIDLAAIELGIDLNTVRKLSQEKASSLSYTFASGPESMPLNDKVFTTQAKIIKELASANEDSIIVNGCANYILEDEKNVFRIYIYAPLESRVNRVKNVYHEDHKNYHRYVEKRDKMRKSYYNNYTTYDWGDANNYDLAINSDIGIEEVASIITEIFKDGSLWKMK
ncbi:MAG: cytidylate kinase-like family protein [Thomasclavelia sp.]|nr:cytidylate kinase-like family protein [Thomasclavelia sp.]